MKLTTIREDSKSGSAAKTQHMLRSAVFELTNSHFIDSELLTRLTDIPVTHVGNGIGASSGGNVVVVWITLIDVKPVPFIASLTQLNDIATNKGRAEQKIPNKYKLRVLARHRGFHRAVAIDDNC